MKKDVLYLCLPPIVAGTYFVVNPTTVYYACSPEHVPKAYDPNDAAWSAHKVEADYRRTNTYLNQLQETSVSGQRFIDFFTHQQTAMWQFLPSYVWPAFHRALDLIQAIDEILQIHPVQAIHYYPTSGHMAEIWTGVITEVAKTKNISLKALGPTATSLRSKLRHHKLGRWIRQQRHHAEIKRIATPPLPKAVTTKKLLFATHKRHWVPLPGDISSFYDEQFFPLLSEFRKMGWAQFIGIDCPYNATIAKAHQNLQTRIQDTPSDLTWRSYHSYATDIGHIKKSHTNSSNHFSAKFKELYAASDFHNTFQYREISLLPALLQTLEQAFIELLPTCSEHLAIAKNILTTEQPNGIAVTYETGPYQRALIIEAQKLGIPTLGLMHGLIFDYHYDYMHTQITTDPAQPGFSVPDITCVWGPLFKKNLTISGNYPDTTVAVTGNWRHDNLLDTSHRIAQPTRKKLFKCSTNQTTVLILSSGQHICDYIRQCLEAVKKHATCVPLIKLHPSDKAEPVRELLGELDYDPKVLFEGQLIEALSGADIVISQRSTTIAEAALLDKTIVLADIYGLGHEYGDTGICLCADTPKELAAAIDKAITDPAIQEQLAKSRQTFKEQYFYKLDGQSASRVVNALESLCPSLQTKSTTEVSV